MNDVKLNIGICWHRKFWSDKKMKENEEKNEHGEDQVATFPYIFI